MKRTLVVGIAGLLVLATAVYVAFVRPAMRPSADTPRAEGALVTSDLVLLAGMNVREAVFLEKWFLGSPLLEPSELAKVPPVPDRTLLDHLRAAGVAPRADLD